MLLLLLLLLPSMRIVITAVSPKEWRMNNGAACERHGIILGLVP